MRINTMGPNRTRQIFFGILFVFALILDCFFYFNNPKERAPTEQSSPPKAEYPSSKSINSQGPIQKISAQAIPQPESEGSTPQATTAEAETRKPVPPFYGEVAIDQYGWTAPVVVPKGRGVKWHPTAPDVWLDTRINQSNEFCQSPFNDSRWKKIKFHGRIETLEFRVTPNSPVQGGKVAYAIFQGPSSNVPLSSVYPPVSSDKTWPGTTLPLKTVVLPSPGYVVGTEIAETIYATDDVLFLTAQGWRAIPRLDAGDNPIQHVPVSNGFRIRVADVEKSVRIYFSFIPDETKMMQTTVPNYQPVVRPYVVPQQPSYYRTSPGGPSYYPSSHNP